MYVNDLQEMRDRVAAFFGKKAAYQGSYRQRGYVLFDLYGVFPIHFVILEEPYDTLEVQLEVTADRVTHTFLGEELLFIENNEAAVHRAFGVLDSYCRLRLPDKFLEEFDAI